MCYYDNGDVKMILKKDIITDENPLLRQKSVDVELPLSKEDEKTIKDMIEYLDLSQDEEMSKKYDLQPGVGIAAPQIGVLKKMFVVKTEDENGKLHHYALINPKIISHSVQHSYLTYGEGCLSVPNPHQGFVKRYYKVKIKAYDYLQQKEVVIVAKDYIAIVLQHEYDHLFGVLFYDHIDKNNPLTPIEGATEIK